MSLELRASVLVLRREATEAKGLFARANEEEKALGYHEPPLYIRPVGETQGAAMLSVGDWKEAKAAYQRALAERPRSGLALAKETSVVPALESGAAGPANHRVFIGEAA